MSLPVKPSGPWCSNCKLGDAEHVISNCVGGRLATGALLNAKNAKKVKFLLIGEAPGARENEIGKPFIGPAGKILDRVLTALKVDPRTIAITNSVRCQPAGDKNPPMAAKRTCRDYLDREIEELQPEVVVAMGTQALSAMRDMASGVAVSNERMRVSEYNGIPMMATYHPAAILYDRTKMSDLYDDLNSILIEQIWKDDPDRTEIVTELVNDEDAYAWLLKQMKRERVIGIDIETVSFTSKIVSIGFSFPVTLPDMGFMVPVFHTQAELDGKKVLKDVRAILLLGSKILVGQNIDFDLSRLARASGGPVAFRCLADDSMAFHSFFNENAENRKLGYLAAKYAGEGNYKDEINLSRVEYENLDRLTTYNGKDASLPPKIIKTLRRHIKEFDYYSPAMIRLYRRIIPFAAAIEASGMRVDKKALRKAARTQRKIIADLNTRVETEAPGVNLASPQQLAGYIYGRYSGLPKDKIPENTLNLRVPDIKGSRGKSHASTAERILAHVDHEFVALLLQFRKASKEYGTYVKGVQKAVEPNGFVYPDVLVIKTERGGTVSGRWTVKNPALQTFSYTHIRSVFISRHGKQDGCLLDIDASQMELRLAAMESGDPTLRGVFTSGGDPHQATADLCGVDRQQGKTINFAAIYGVSIPGLVRQGLSELVAKRVSKTLKKEWKVLYRYQDDRMKEIVRNGELCTSYGRWRRLPGATMATPMGRFMVREGVNFLYQSAASDLMQLLGWSMMLNLEHIAFPVMSNHDGLTWDLRTKDLDLVLDKMKESVIEFPQLVSKILEIDLDIPLEFTIKSGPNWLEQKGLTKFST